MYVDSLGNRWYKGNLHTHTTASDGKLSYEEAVARYRQAGYDFLAVSDHWVPSQTVEEPDFLLISGVEYDANFETDYHGHSHKVCVHLNGVGFTAQPAVTRGQTPQEMVDAIHAAGGIVTFNHPEWSRNTAEDIWVLHGLDGVEIYNHGCSWESKSGYSGVHVDLLALGGRMLPVMAADDAHRYVGDECGGFLWLAAESLSHADVLDALRQGRFIASMGPWVQTHLDGDTVVVESTPVSYIRLITDIPYGFAMREPGMTLTRHALPAGASWYRVEAMDKDGNWAWSTPVKVI